MKKPNLVLPACLAAVVLYCLVPIAFAADGEVITSTVETPPGASVTVSPDYLIAEEDVLRMDVWGESQLSNMQMQVTSDGKINVPYIGEMQARGLTQYELTRKVAKAFEEKEILYNPNVQITLLNIHKPTVRVWGAVNRPGEIFFKEGDRVMDAVAGAGSYIAETAWLDKATLTRKGSDKPIPVDLKKMVEGDLSQNYELQRGDTVYIPTEDYQNKFYVLGQVIRPGIYDLKDKTSLLSAISLAGGPTPRGKLKSTVVVRGDPKKPERVKCNLNKLFDDADVTQDVTLQPGDVVIVPETKSPDWSKISQLLSTLVNVSYLRRLGLF
ncbi:MAG: polysaccharide biosynthesis/export family protein [Armatimonadota bacterium]